MVVKQSLRQKITAYGQGIWQNPVAVKELRSRMRGNRTFIVLTLYLLGLVTLVMAIYLPLAYASRASGVAIAEAMIGKAVLGLIVMVQIFLVAFIAPAFTAGSISGEKQQQTFDLLRTTLLTPQQVIQGKLLSALSYVLLLILAAIPLQAIAFLLGGVTLGELIIAQLIMLVSGVTFTLIGLSFSVWMRTTIGATVASYAAAIFLIAGLPALILLSEIVFGNIRSDSFFSIVQYLWRYGIVFINLPLTVLFSEIALIENNSYFSLETTIYLTGGSRTWLLPSPWLVYVPFYTIFNIVLYGVMVWRLRHIYRT